MQNPIQKFGQSNIFWWNFAHVSYLSMSTKVCAGFFLFCLDVELFAKKLKRPGFHTFLFYILTNNSRSRQNKENPEHLFVDMIE